MKKVNWEKVINGLDVEFPDKGLEPPKVENTHERVPIGTVGNLTRISMDIFVFDSDELDQAYMFKNDNMRIYQGITLAQTQELVKRNKKKKT